MAKPNSLLIAVREVLFREWDPIGVNGNELCRAGRRGDARRRCRQEKGVGSLFR